MLLRAESSFSDATSPLLLLAATLAKKLVGRKSKNTTENTHTNTSETSVSVTIKPLALATSVPDAATADHTTTCTHDEADLEIVADGARHEGVRVPKPKSQRRPQGDSCAFAECPCTSETHAHTRARLRCHLFPGAVSQAARELRAPVEPAKESAEGMSTFLLDAALAT